MTLFDSSLLISMTGSIGQFVGGMNESLRGSLSSAMSMSSSMPPQTQSQEEAEVSHDELLQSISTKLEYSADNGLAGSISVQDGVKDHSLHDPMDPTRLGTSPLSKALEALSTDGILCVFFVAHNVLGATDFKPILATRYKAYKEKGIDIRVLVVPVQEELDKNSYDRLVANMPGDWDHVVPPGTANTEAVASEVAQKVSWESNTSHCGKCSAQIGKRHFNRRHHCRLCGGCFCGTCAPRSEQLVDGQTKMTRVCTRCVMSTQEASSRIQVKDTESIDMCMALVKRFHVKTAPTLVVLDKAGKTLTSDGVAGINADKECQGLAWTRKPRLSQHSSFNGSLRSLNSSRDGSSFFLCHKKR